MNINTTGFISSALLAILLSAAVPASANNEAHFHNHHSENEDDPAVREMARIPKHWRTDDMEELDDEDHWVRFKILGFNDFHGHLSGGRKVGGRPVGSAPVLAAYLQTAEEEAEDGAFIVHAGDHVGASPPVSALLQDEPSISFLNLMANKYCKEDHEYDRGRHGGGNDDERDESDKYQEDYRNGKCNLIGTLGNHEFDEGKDELLRLLNGANHPDGPYLQAEYSGAGFPYVSANVVVNATGKPLLKPYVIRQIKGMPVAFIGAVLKQTPSIVTPTGVAGLTFLDEADAINQYVHELKDKKVRAIVVTIHQGTRQRYYDGPTDAQINKLDGSIADIVDRLDDEVDIVISGHAHSFTNALIPNRNGKNILVAQAFSYGTAYDDIDVAIDPRSRDIVEKSARIITTYADVEPGLTLNEKVMQLVADAEKAVEPLINRVIGTTTNGINRSTNPSGESPLGNLIADAQRTAMGTDFAFMNAGGIRADIPAGVVTWGDLFTVQPFGNDLVTMQLTGAQIVQLLNQQWDGQPYPRILKVSGLSYTWDNAQPVGDRIIEVRKTDGQLLDLAASYSVTVNSFIAAGGDNYSVLKQGTNRIIGPNDLDALVDYISKLPQPFSANIEGRIKRLN